MPRTRDRMQCSSGPDLQEESEFKIDTIPSYTATQILILDSIPNLGF